MATTSKAASKTSSPRKSRAAAGKKDGQDGSEPGLVEQAGSLLGDASDLAQHAQKMRATWEKRLHKVAVDHPYLTLAGASGTGFVLGGGLRISMTKRLWLIGARLAVSIALQKLSQSNVVAQVFGSGSDDS